MSMVACGTQLQGGNFLQWLISCTLDMARCPCRTLTLGARVWYCVPVPVGIELIAAEVQYCYETYFPGLRHSSHMSPTCKPWWRHGNGATLL